jgi:hypothetical protein
VPRTGRVLLYAAEDALHIVRRRFDGICEAAGVALAELESRSSPRPPSASISRPIATASPETVARLQPRLLILDPFVRLHRIDENALGERIAEALADSGGAMPFTQLRACCRVRAATLYGASQPSLQQAASPKQTPDIALPAADRPRHRQHQNHMRPG